ncbi:MAG TPA: hypothetical protein VGU68_02315 [Ktedonobacteraceae bacterium]|nr:hypothetical protein [Ktedonobacteraceae bacterium]
MHIMTEDRGWQPLDRQTDNTIEEAPPRYRGPLPSFDCQAFIKDNEQAHAEWQEKRATLQKEHE